MSDKEKNNKNGGDKPNLWEMVTKTIIPLHPDRKPKDSRIKESSISKDKSKKMETRKESSSSLFYPKKIENEPKLHSLSIDKRTDEKLRRGKMRPEGTLDLHGHTREEARHALIQFIQRGHAQGKRAVLIITGKGYHSAEPGGILRQAVPEWLEEHPLNQIVLKYHKAQPKDGGEGALYVLIRRKR